MWKQGTTTKTFGHMKITLQRRKRTKLTLSVGNKKVTGRGRSLFSCVVQETGLLGNICMQFIQSRCYRYIFILK